jgi:hypothetical protein
MSTSSGLSQAVFHPDEQVGTPGDRHGFGRVFGQDPEGLFGGRRRYKIKRFQRFILS